MQARLRLEFSHAVFLGLGLLVAGCHPGGHSSNDASVEVDGGTGSDGGQDLGGDAAVLSPDACPAGPAGVSCFFDLWNQVDTSCTPELQTAFTQSVDARHGDFPVWKDGKAIFIARAPASVGGVFNNWQATGLDMHQVCSVPIYGIETPVASGRNPYKLVFSGTWKLDPENFAFVYDDFTGNPDGRNSVLNTYDSGLGTLVAPDQQLCSTALNRCGPLTTYLPPGYGDPQKATKIYPVLFMHDGQNIYDNHTCCYGHTGWEVNNTMDTLIAAQTVEPAVIVGFNHGGDNRQREYTGDLRDAFMDFQVHTIQPTAEQLWRVDPARAYVAGSSFGGYITLLLAFNYPEVYVGAASLSGAFFPQAGTSSSINAVATAKGKVAVGLYMDNGGEPSDGADSYFDNQTLRDQLVAEGWVRSDEPTCSQLSDDTLCYYWADGATHDELAWKARAHYFLEYFFGTKSTP